MTTVALPRSAGRSLLALGLLLTALGVIGYVVQVRLGRLSAPWYLPALATLGALLVLVSLWQRRTVWRILATILMLLVAAATWAFMLAAPLPRYTGPLAVGKPFPPFETMCADGTPFTQADLVGAQNSVLVFFRGRW